MNQRGQASIITLLLVGVILATLIMEGYARQARMVRQFGRLERSQLANDVLSSAAKTVQQIYANQSGCDPDALDKRLKLLPNLPLTAPESSKWAVADPSAAAGSRARYNLCPYTAVGTAGCRQIYVTQEGRSYIVTVGTVTRISRPLVGVDVNSSCARDATVTLSTTINGSVFFRRATLINTCSYTSCGGAGSPQFSDFSTDPSVGTPVSVSFTPISVGKTTACGVIPSMYRGNMVSGAIYNKISMDDLRWARRYLETGGADVGETTFLQGLTGTSNGACSVAASSNQCKQQPCVPPLTSTLTARITNKISRFLNISFVAS